MTEYQREVLTELDRRKDVKDNPCKHCNGIGASSRIETSDLVCYECLGQGVTLSHEERTVIIEVAGFYRKNDPADDILNANILE